MEVQETSLLLKERVKLLAYDDLRLGRPVVVDLVLAPDAASLDELAARVNLRDLVELVRQAHEKLPRAVDVADAELSLEQEQSPVSETLVFDLPPDLVRKRFVFPASFDRAIERALAEHGTATTLKSLLFGTGKGDPLARLGLLGRAAAEERVGNADLPFYYATLLLIMRALAEQLPRHLIAEGKIKAAYDEVRGQLRIWTAGHLARVKHPVLVERLLNNPLAPYALNRLSRVIPVEEATDKHLPYPNLYGMTPELARALDEHFEGSPARLGEDGDAHAALRAKVLHAADLLDATGTFLDAEDRTRRRLGLLAAILGLAVAAAMTWTRLPPTEWLDAGNPLAAQAVATLAAVAVAGAGTAAMLALAGRAALRGRRGLRPAWGQYVRLRRTLRRSHPLRFAFARALARERLGQLVAAAQPAQANASLADVALLLPRWGRAGAKLQRWLRRAEGARSFPRRDWTHDLPRLLRGYLKLKNDQLNYRKLTRIAFPAQDLTSLYEPDQLREKWRQSACVCFDDGFATLISGAAHKAAVYFIDVAGSTELSTTHALGNALEHYTRLLPLANEAGGTPLWRKEVGVGRYYSYPVHDGLRRAGLTAQACRHPKVGMQVGIGLSVSEIYTDVTTGDFLNEAANRAARLNARDEIVGAYIAARYVRRPFGVYVKYGRLHNAGIALDDKALHALGVSGWEAVELVPPLEWRFPVIAEDGGAGSVALFAERLQPAVAAVRLAGLGDAQGFGRVRERLDRTLVFEIFCHAGGIGQRYHTPLDGRSLGDVLRAAGVEHAVFAARDVEREAAVTHLPVVLPDGQTLSVVVKYEKALLKGLGATAIAEVNVPVGTPGDAESPLGRFLAGL